MLLIQYGKLRQCENYSRRNYARLIIASSRELQQEKFRTSHHRSVSGITAGSARHVSPSLRLGNYSRRSYARLTIAPSRELQQEKLRTSHRCSVSGITAGEARHVSPSLRLMNYSRRS